MSSQIQSTELIDNCIKSFIASRELAPRLKDAVRYALFPGGKRIRPLFSLSLCQDFGGDAEALLPAASALELLHCASLVHDDLPALDDDDMRRGKASCHKAFDEATAILAGDALTTLAIELAAESNSKVLAGEGSRILARVYSDLCSGQQLDLLSARERGELIEIHRKKTGGLFAAASELAVIASGMDENARKTAKNMGEWIGVAFQIVDDYLDFYGTEEQKGRPTGSDLRNQKNTYFSSKESSARALELLAHAEDNIKGSMIGLISQAPNSSGETLLSGKIVESILSRVPRGEHGYAAN